MADDTSSYEFWISLGSQITGGIAGAVVSLTCGGATGTVLGGAASPIISTTLFNILNDFSNRRLSHKEKVRVGAAATYIIHKITSNINDHHHPREDGFFDRDQCDKSDADEILEGVFIKCQSSHEERKVLYYSNLFANIAFTNNISSDEANYYLHLVETFNYRKLKILALLLRKNELSHIKLFDQNMENYEVQDLGYEYVSITQEIWELFNYGLVTQTYLDKDDYAIIHYSHVIPAKLHLSLMGTRLAQLLGLLEMPLKEIEELAKNLQHNDA